MHLQCNNCGWEQDDFWSPLYNPIKGLQNYEGILLDVTRLDEIDPLSGLSRKEMVLRALRLATKRVEEMTYPVRPCKEAIYPCPRCQGKLVLSRHREDEVPLM